MSVKCKKREKTGEERKGKETVETAVSLINPILLSAYAETSEADSLAFGTECRIVLDLLRRFEPFWFFIARQI